MLLGHYRSHFQKALSHLLMLQSLPSCPREHLLGRLGLARQQTNQMRFSALRPASEEISFPKTPG